MSGLFIFKMEYQIVALAEDYEGGRVAGVLQTSGTQIRIELEAESIVWNIQDIRLEKGGSGNQLLYIKHVSQDLVVYTRDKKILKDPLLKRNKTLAQSATKARASFRNARMSILIVIFVIIAIALSAIFFRSAIVEVIANKVPIEWEEEAGNKLFETLSKQYDVVEDSAISHKLDSLFQPLVVATNYPIDFKFYICQNASLNAFALPGGHVVINTGTINKIERVEELYGVLAHELAHVTKRHHLRGLIGNLGTFILLQGMFGSEAGIIGSLGESAGQLSSLFYSRKFETESDLTGYEYLKTAEIDPKGMVEFFERIHHVHKEIVDSTVGEENSEMISQLESFVSTHPGTEKRMGYLSKKIESDGLVYEPVDYDIRQLQDFIDKNLN